MTDLVYHSKYYKGYNNGKGLINSLEQPIVESIISSCRPDDLFINSTWLEDDEELNFLLLQNPKRIVVYSGMDWHDTGYRKLVHDKLIKTGKELLYIGNTDGKYYFSFWLFFIEKYLQNFYKEPTAEIPIDKLFMCLNRKRHEHRVMLVDLIFENNLDKQGLVSLGGNKDILPTIIPNDITQSEGDSSAALNHEGIVNDINSLGNLSNWNRHLINVVTETTVGSSTFISEKTWKPILGLKPFMILGDYKIYSSQGTNL